MKKVFVIICLFMLAGCSAHLSPLNSSGEKIIYATDDEERVFSEAHAALEAVIPNVPIMNVNASSIHGYSARDIFALDYTDYLVRVFPAIGITRTQEEVRGYYVEVTADGTRPQASSRSKRIYTDLNNRLANFARPVSVLEIRPGKYIKERDEFPLNTDPSLREGGTIKTTNSGSSMSDEIKKLDELRKQGLITEQEYQIGKTKILSK